MIEKEKIEKFNEKCRLALNGKDVDFDDDDVLQLSLDNLKKFKIKLNDFAGINIFWVYPIKQEFIVKEKLLFKKIFFDYIKKK